MAWKDLASDISELFEPDPEFEQEAFWQGLQGDGKGGVGVRSREDRESHLERMRRWNDYVRRRRKSDPVFDAEFRRRHAEVERARTASMTPEEKALQTQRKAAWIRKKLASDPAYAVRRRELNRLKCKRHRERRMTAISCGKPLQP